MSNLLETYTAREAANLAAATTEKTAWVPCFMRKQASFEIVATDADTLTTVTLEVCNMDPTVAGEWRAAAAENVMQLLGTATGVALNAGGRTVVACSLSDKSPYIPWIYCRLSLTSGANQIDGLAVVARTCSDPAMATLAQPFSQASNTDPES